MSLRLRAALIEASAASGPHEIDAGKVRRYAEAMARGDAFPPIRVVDYGDSLMIIDGHHRAAAARRAGVHVTALIADGEAFENLDIALRDVDQGRADDPQHWSAT